MNKYKIGSLFGYLLGDGWLEKNKKVGGFSGRKEDLEKIKQDLTLYLNSKDKMTISTRKTFSPKYNIIGTTSQFFFGKDVYMFFLERGHPAGKKVENNYIIPDWIVNGDTETKRGFLSGLMSAEGSTPTMQKNNQTPKVLELTLTKRKIQKESFILICNQLIKIFKDLNIDANFSLKETFTCDTNLKMTIVISNSLNNMKNYFKNIGYEYCERKQINSQKILNYLTLKEKEIQKIRKNKDAILENKENLTAKQLSHKHNIPEGYIWSWRRGRGSQKTKLPKNFPKLIL